jgi:hypothetical protein
MYAFIPIIVGLATAIYMATGNTTTNGARQWLAHWSL